MNLEERAIKIHELLLEHFGCPEWRDPLPPLDELVSTILSQNTNDSNRDCAYKRLRAAFPTWEAVRDADITEVIDAIRPAGLANQKGPRIQQVLLEITEQRGSLNLDFLAELPVEEAKSWLMSFKGVGPKTAAIVLLFSLNRPAFPVDTHIHRVTGRLGLRPEQLSADQSHDYLADLFPPETYFSLHLNLIRLGREVCQARRPRCSECPLQLYCDWNQMTNQPAACSTEHAEKPFS